MDDTVWTHAMAYLLKCPSCNSVTESAFVRVGAVVTCEHCHQPFRIDEELVKREIASPGARGQAGDDPLAVTRSEQDRTARRTVNDRGEEIGLSGLSEMMQKDVGPTHEIYFEPELTKTKNKRNSRTHYHRQMVERQKAYRRTKTVFVLIVVGLLMITSLMIWGLWLMSR